MGHPRAIQIQPDSEEHRRPGRRVRWTAVLAVPISIAMTFATLEAGYRAARYLVRGPDSLPTVSDPELGWVHNTKRRPVTRVNGCGEEVVTLAPASPYLVKHPACRDGTPILFLGDSTTHAHEVSTGAAFYDVFETLTEGRYAVWAAGVGGYGNWQEYLVLTKIYDEIRPDIVIWQLDSNDVTDNVLELDRASLSSSLRPRPYLDPVSGEAAMRDPAWFPFNVSQGARYLFSRLVNLEIRCHLGFVAAVEQWLSPPPEQKAALERRGLRVLDTVVRDARRRYPGTRFIGLSLSQSDDGSYAEIFLRHGAEYWPNFTERVRQSSSRPTQCLPWDRHWNHEGNRIAGRLIAESVTR